MNRRLAVEIATLEPVTVQGTFHRHVSTSITDLRASAAGGRWGPPGAFAVLYLGRPERSVIVEAYRHLVDDDLDGQLDGSHVVSRNFLTCEVDLPNVLDLREPMSRQAAGLTVEALRSDVGDHGPCQRVGAIAHQLGLYGVMAPAATGLGETLAIFERNVPVAYWPKQSSTERWAQLPPDPRRLRAVEEA